MAKQQGKLNKIVNFVLVVFLVVGIIGLLAYLTGGFTNRLSTFSVDCNGKNVTTSASGYVVIENEPLNVKVKYAFGGNKVSGYSIKIVPNALAGKDFDFTVDGYVYSYQAEKDLTNGFDVGYGENEFTIKPKGNLNAILGAIYPNKEVSDSLAYSYENMFTLIVYSYDGAKNVRIHFTVLEKVLSIELDKGVIIF